MGTDLHLLQPAALDLPLRPSQYAAGPIPSLNDFQAQWTAWDIVTKAMIPQEELLSKPIKLRNSLIFYLGHIPTFAGKVYRRWTSIGLLLTQAFRYSLDPCFGWQAYRP